MPQFIDARENVVTAAIDGELRGSNLARLDGYPHIRVVHRTDFDGSKVALVSGGGSGHEPAHAGFVGRGMLTAAVCGDVFASPSVEAVLAGIMAVTGDGGCLLIVKNYTGDRLNFGLAAERAKALGRDVEMVVVADDIALPDLPQPRGVAGTLFVHKIAGHMAEAGASLAEVADAARAVAEAASSYGVALSTCTVPGSEPEGRIPEGKIELGLGIHGEPGVRQVDYEGAASAVQTVMRGLKDHAAPADAHVALLNDLGSTTPLELGIIADEVLSRDYGLTVSHAIGPARLMTSLDMHGFSVSLLPAKPEWVEALTSDVEPWAWPGLSEVGDIAVTPMPEGLEGRSFEASPEPGAEAVIRHVCGLLTSMEADLNALDAKTGDGDTGSTVAGAARAVERALPDMPLASVPDTFASLSDTLARAMGGSSGVLMAIFFQAAADAANEGADVAAALSAGLARIKEYGGADVGHRTMVDALDPALAALPQGLSAAAEAAREGADGTARMGAARSGRSAYLSEDSLTGITDPGAEAVARTFEGLVKS